MFWRISTFLAVIMCAVVALAVGKVRTWTSTDGRTMQAEFVRELDGEATFLKDGKLIVIKLEKLSEKDQQVVKDLAAGKEPEEDPFTTPAEKKPGEDKAAASPADAPGQQRAEKSEKPKKPITIQSRTWTDRFGAKSSGKFVRVDGNDVVINRGTRVLTVPFSNLSDGDQEYVREVLISQGKEDAIPTAQAGAGGAGAIGGGVGPGGVGAGAPGVGRAGPGVGVGVNPGSMPGASMPPGSVGTPGGMAGGIAPGGIGPGRGGPIGGPGMGAGAGLPPGIAPPGAGMGPGIGPNPATAGIGAPVGPGIAGEPGSIGPPGGMMGGIAGAGPGMPATPGMSSPPGMAAMPGGMSGAGGMGMGGAGAFPGGSFPTASIPPVAGPSLPGMEIEEYFECSKCKTKLSKLQASGSTCPSCGTTWGFKQDGFGNKTMTAAGRSQISSVGVVIVIFILLGMVVFIALFVGIVVAIVKATNSRPPPAPMPQQRYY